jgi:hypothetical protein
VASTDGYHLKMPKGYRYLMVSAHGGTLRSRIVMLPDKLILEFLDVALATPDPTVPKTPAAMQTASRGTKSACRRHGRARRCSTSGRSRQVRFFLTPAAIPSSPSPWTRCASDI